MSRQAQSYPAKWRYKGEIARKYLEERTASAKWQREQEVVARLLRELPSGATILDVPIGTGRFVPYYAEGNHMVYGVDISLDMLCIARDVEKEVKNVAGLIQADAESLPVADGAVDYVVCARLMNWLPLSVLSAVLSEFRRVARQGVFVEIRVCRPIGLWQLIQNLVSESVSSSTPMSLIRRLAHLIRCGTIVVFSSVTTALMGRSFLIKHSKNKATFDDYVFHSMDQVLHVFFEQELVVEDFAVVDERIDYMHREITPYIMYKLRPKESGK